MLSELEPRIVFHHTDDGEVGVGQCVESALFEGQVGVHVHALNDGEAKVIAQSYFCQTDRSKLQAFPMSVNLMEDGFLVGILDK